MPQALMRNAPLVGRVLLSLIFILSGVGKVFDWNGSAAYMASQGLPAVSVLLFLAVVAELVGGVSLLVGFKARWGALLLIAFLIPVSLLMHNFWALDGQMQQLQMAMFLKNLAIMGGLALVVAHGPGSLSLDEKRGE